MIDTITGGVRQPRDGHAVFKKVYDGPVSIRDRDGHLEIAFFAPPIRVRLPLEGTLDGEPVQMTGINVRDLDPNRPVSIRAPAPRAIVATVVPLI